jgi:hypothetical protein
MKVVSGSSLRNGVSVLAIAAALAGCTSAAATPITIVITPAPATATPTSTATPTETPAATPTETPTPTPSPSPSPTSAAAGCTGTPTNKAFFVEAASKLHFDVYCAVLPTSWWLDSGSYVTASGGYLEVSYKNAGGAELGIREGGWCPPDMACIAPGATIGPASFDGLAGTLYLNTTTYTLAVGTYANPLYMMIGHGMSQAQFTAWAAAVLQVPKA